MDHRISVKTATTIVLLIARVCGEIDPGIRTDSHTSANTLGFDTNASIGIVGGGFAGLAAFAKLRSMGFANVDLFEASNRLGGRVYPVPYENGFIQHGAQFINGAQNPIFALASRLGVVSAEMEDDQLFLNAEYQSGRCVLDLQHVAEFEEFAAELETRFAAMARDPRNWNRTVGAVYGESFEQFLNQRTRNADELRVYAALSRFYQTYYEGEWAAPIENLSLRNYATWNDQSDKFAAFNLDKCGYAALLEYLVEEVPAGRVHLNQKVSTIDYTGPKTVLKMVNGGVLDKQFDFVIVTVPLGHLKAHAGHLFKPSLPARKMDAIQKMGFGSLLKVFLEYDRPFWSNSTSSFVPLYIDGCSHESYLSKVLHTFQPLEWQSNVLVGWLSGEGPKEIDWISDEELAQHITQHFRDTTTGIDVPYPKRLIRTSWLRDDNYRGSYTYITAEAAQLPQDPVELLARPVTLAGRPRVQFAGEATHGRVYQTTIGAYLSGRREADRIRHFLSHSRNRTCHADLPNAPMASVLSLHIVE